MLIDATAVPADRGGVGRYVDCLVTALDADGAAPMVVCQPRDAELYASLAPHADVLPAVERLVARTARLTWEQTTLPWLIRRARVDVLHCPHYTMPLASPVATVVTLHDATFFTDPRVHSPVKARFFRAWTRTSLRRADVCVVPSASTARELRRVVGAGVARNVDSLRVVHHGVDADRFHPPSPEEKTVVRLRLRLDNSPYVAFLGALEPRKNVPALIRGFARASQIRSSASDPTALVLAGQPGWDSQVEQDLQAVPHRVRVIRAGYLPLEELSGFLGGAAVVAYPSLGEGFGLPVLEAMAAGAAVLTTRRLSLPEVGGDAVAYCGIDATDIAAGLVELLDDPARRAELSAAAQRRAKDFSWAASAMLHREAYSHAAVAHRRSR
ncbi:MAG: glycosyl transferase family 1 [Pseudonocardiales bacterium]|nr:glycosyltransferase family 4 protein [Actinomycetota bacterium]PZS23622.1 MAG: glycosyl transferase family 1 [Pseudonocardiales bacterium]